MAQTVTFTRRSDAPAVAGAPATFTVEIPDDANAATAGTIEDSEITAARAAGSARPANAAEHVDLAHYDATMVGTMPLDSARYRAVIGGSGSAGGTAGGSATITPPAAPATPAGSELPSVLPSASTNGIYLMPSWMRGFGDYNHDRFVLDAGFTRASQASAGVTVRYGVGAAWQHAYRSYTLPGGGDASSIMNMLGLTGHVGVIGYPESSRRFHLDAIFMPAILGFWSPGATTETVRAGGGQACIDAGGTPSQCNRAAGDLTYNTGRTGTLDSRTGNSVDMSGGALDLSLLLGLGYDIAVGDSTTLSISAGARGSMLFTFPSGGGGGTIPAVGPYILGNVAF